MRLIELCLESANLLRHHAPNEVNHHDQKKDAQDEVIELSFLPETAFFRQSLRQTACRSPNIDVEKGERENAVIAIDELANVYIGDGKGVCE